MWQCRGTRSWPRELAGVDGPVRQLEPWWPWWGPCLCLRGGPCAALQALLDVAAPLLAVQAADPAFPEPALRALLRLLLRELQPLPGAPPAGSGGTLAAVRCAAAAAGLSGVAAAVSQGQRLPGFAADLYGPVACEVGALWTLRRLGPGSLHVACMQL